MHQGDTMKKLFATDYDGTLFQYGEVSQRDLDTIRKFRKQGNLFGIATGRMINSIKEEIFKYNIPVDFVIGINGGVIVDHNFKTLHSLSIENDIGLKVQKHLKESGAVHYSITDGYNLCNQGEKSINLKPFDRPCQEIVNNDIRGLYARMPSIDMAREVCLEINDHYGDHVKALPNYNYVDIASSRTDKYVALSHFVKDLNIDLIGTSGDAHNDYLMLKNYHGYAMHHGDETIVSKISRRAHTVSEALENFMEIKR